MDKEQYAYSVESEQEPSAWPKRPWLDIWVKPRGTIRTIVENDPARYVLIFAALAGIAQALERASSRDLGNNSPSLVALLAIVLIVGSIGGLVSIYITAAIFRWTGSLLGGRASSIEVRAAIAWSSIPIIFTLVFWVPQLALYGVEMFTSVTPNIDNNPWPLLCLGLIQLVLYGWAFVILLKTVGEVHGFSAWRALIAVALPTVTIVIVVFGCLLLTNIGG
ncbi:MAG TPA: Yip1 family protein [candidate division Zixibacteria bacterium]|nr:Yip1 family protein [candidate division Zixibacteria bacterium]